MTPAASERRLAGRYIVWGWHESHSAIDAGGNVTGREFRKIWRYDQVRRKAGDMLLTAKFERVPVRDAYIVDEIAGWPVWDRLGYKPLTQAEFDAIIARCQPQTHGGSTQAAGSS